MTAPGSIPKGTLVDVWFDNGGPVRLTLEADYKPTYGCWFRGFTAAGTPMPDAFVRVGWDILTVTPITETEAAA